mgnify:CR=1 FL=1
MKIRILLALLFYSVVTFANITSKKDRPNAIKVTKIWNYANHNAFTDLIKFKGNYYCSFRESSGHVSGSDGLVRILKSRDAKKWMSVALLKKEGIDLRDPKLSITPDGRIMVIIGGSIYKNDVLLGRKPHVSFSNKSGNKFSNPEKVSVDPEIASWGDWIWRVTWHNGIGYGIDYQVTPQLRKKPSDIYLVKTKDGVNFQKVSKLEVDEYPNESTIRFDKQNNVYALIRRDVNDKMGVWAKSKPPYTEWEYTELNERLGGPNFIFTADEKVIVATREYARPGTYTRLLIGNKTGNFKQIIRLPSGGDTSYPGLVLEKNRLLVSYYSSHEGKTAIYIAEIPLTLLFKNLK